MTGPFFMRDVQMDLFQLDFLSLLQTNVTGLAFVTLCKPIGYGDIA